MLPAVVLLILSMLAFLFYKLEHFYDHPRKKASRTPRDLGYDFDNLFFPTEKGLRLHGWFVPSSVNRDGKAIILVHGWSRNAERMLEFLPLLNEQGYHCLLIDARNHGESDADGHSSMIKFARDIQASVDHLQTRPDVNKEAIGVMGHSIGAAGSIYAAALDKRIRFVIALAAFSHPEVLMRDELHKRGMKWDGLISLLFSYFQFRIGKSFSEIAPENNIGKIDRPILLVHGTEDSVVPYIHFLRLKEKARAELTTAVSLPGGTHSDFLRFDEMKTALTNFLQRVSQQSVLLQPGK